MISYKKRLSEFFQTILFTENHFTLLTSKDETSTMKPFSEVKCLNYSMFIVPTHHKFNKCDWAKKKKEGIPNNNIVLFSSTVLTCQLCFTKQLPLQFL